MMRNQLMGARQTVIRGLRSPIAAFELIIQRGKPSGINGLRVWYSLTDELGHARNVYIVLIGVDSFCMTATASLTCRMVRLDPGHQEEERIRGWLLLPSLRFPHTHLPLSHKQ